MCVFVISKVKTTTVMRYHYTVQDSRPEEQLIWASTLNTYGTRTMSDFTEDRKGNYCYQYCKMASFKHSKAVTTCRWASIFVIHSYLPVDKEYYRQLLWLSPSQPNVGKNSILTEAWEWRRVKGNMNVTSSCTAAMDHQNVPEYCVLSPPLWFAKYFVVSYIAFLLFSTLCM